MTLPFLTNETKFATILERFFESESVTSYQAEYMRKKLEKKAKWAKCFVKQEFTGGVSTTSRVEGLHAVQKKYLTSSSDLKTVFYSFRSLEKIQISKFKEEFQKPIKDESFNCFPV